MTRASALIMVLWLENIPEVPLGLDVPVVVVLVALYDTVSDQFPE